MTLTHGGDWAGFETEYGAEAMDFSANISPLGFPDGVKKAAQRALNRADRYPDPLCRSLRERLSEVHEIPAAQIVCGNGAADLIYRICSVIRPKSALLMAPDFGEYEKALRTENCTVHFLSRDEADGFQLDPGLLAEMGKEADVIILSNPNNPTGLLTERKALLRLLDARTDCPGITVIDECFMDFTEEPEAYSILSEIRNYPGLVVLKAFTKTCAMPGLRLGYAVCGSENFAERLQNAGQPWPVSNVAQEAGIAATEETAYVLQLRKLISRERKRMTEALAGAGLQVVPGTANYLLFWSNDPDLAGKLRAKEILIRDCSNYAGLSGGWFRIAIRTEEENDLLLKALREVL